ncbi:MAG: hypothetical protein JSW51_08865 [Gemmatimonadota bacterium]|nr:MAG: hypothetical protein JSW51_08865 [Gemmatimonadota bacterium]
MGHCSTQELLEVRNGEGSLGAKTHVNECDQCRDELDRLHQRVAALRALPSLNPPRDRWSVVRQSIVEQRRRIWFVRTGWAAAAAIALALGANGLVPWPAAAPSESELELQTLLDQSVQLDGELVRVAARPRVVSGLTAVTIVDLEDQISLIDTEIGLIDQRVLRALTAREEAAERRELDVQFLRSVLAEQADQDQLRRLLQERLILLDVLVNTRDKRTVYVGH